MRKGTKAALVAFYREIAVEGTADDAVGADDSPRTAFIARATPVFNAAQVDGFDPISTLLSRHPATPRPDLDALVARRAPGFPQGSRLG